jgi:light-regulated signal transduction histidine kinase (bacteriophytochrome)
MDASFFDMDDFLRDITESQEYLHKIENQDERLREIAWIHSHRVRAPVASILGLAQLCSLDDSPNAEIIPRLKKRLTIWTKLL